VGAHDRMLRIAWRRMRPAGGKAGDEVDELDGAVRCFVGKFLPLDIPPGSAQRLFDETAGFLERWRTGRTRPEFDLLACFLKSFLAGEFFPNLRRRWDRGSFSAGARFAFDDTDRDRTLGIRLTGGSAIRRRGRFASGQRGRSDPENEAAKTNQGVIFRRAASRTPQAVAANRRCHNIRFRSVRVSRRDAG